MIFNKKNTVGFVAAFMILLPGCTDSANFDSIEEGRGASDDHTVSFLVSLQEQSLFTRADESILSPISSGSKIEELIYAIYEVEFEADGTTVNTATLVPVSQDRDQQTITVSSSSWPVNIKLALDPAKDYRVAFWAQSSAGKGYYDTHDLTAVKVNYSSTDTDSREKTDHLNNDETRDAFCAYAAIPKNFAGNKKVVLHRPFAQLNIGTAGWDYEGVANIEPDPAVLTQSKVTIDGAAQYYNVVTGKSIVDNTHPTTSVTFDFSLLPAFYEVTGIEGEADITKYTPIEGENFLKVILYKDGQKDVVGTEKTADTDFFAYRGWDYFTDYRDAKGDFKAREYEYTYKENGENKTEKHSTSEWLFKGIYPYTETYKYLSMSYVLVPEASDKNSTDDAYERGSVLDEVSFKIKGKIWKLDFDDDSKSEITDADCDPISVFTIKNVPVQKNWRTNILGNDFFIYNLGFKIDIVPTYCGDRYNDDDAWKHKNTNTVWPDDYYSSQAGNAGSTSDGN